MYGLHIIIICLKHKYFGESGYRSLKPTGSELAEDLNSIFKK